MVEDPGAGTEDPGHIKNLMSLLFDRAKLWKLEADNPIGLVKVKGISKRLKRRGILTADEYVQMVALMQDPYRTMFILATCTGLRVSEILALTWERLNFQAGTMLVSEAAVNGRIGRCKTEDSMDDVPLDANLAQVLLDWRTEGGASVGVALRFCSYWRLPACRPDPAESHPTCRHKNWYGRSGLAYLSSWLHIFP